MKTLITGARGFTAFHLIRHLSRDSEEELFRSDLPDSGSPNGLIPCDLTDEKAVLHLIDSINPDRVYHLAGTFTNHYPTDYAANVLSTKNICEALLSVSPRCRIFLVGSAAEYGMIQAVENPVNETHPLCPVSVYGLTKSFQTQLMGYYTHAFGMDLVMARTFNLIGKGISSRLFYGRLLEQIRQYRAGKTDKIVLGDLEPRRDFIDIEQAVRGYRLIMEKGSPGLVYNVGTGKSVQVKDIVKETLGSYGLGMECVQSIVPGKKRRWDVPDIRADITRLESLSRSPG